MKYLTKVTEVYRIDTEEEVDSFIKDQKSQNIGELVKYNSSKKEVKAKGELIDSYFRVEITRIMNNEKEPDEVIEINYTVE